MPRARSSAASRPRRPACCRASTRPIYTPYIDTGDHVVIVNAAKVKLTGRKEEQKLYRYHSGYEGGLREERAKDVRQKNAGPHRRRSRARHAAQDEDGRSDVAQAEGLRGRRSSARGAEAQPAKTQQVRGRITWQQRISITAPGGARHRPPACSSGPAPAPSPSTTSRSKRPSPPKRCAPRSSSRWRVTETTDKFDVLATIAGGGIAGQAGALRLGIARALVEYNAELRHAAEEGRLADARRAHQGTQEVRHGGRAQALPVQQTLDNGDGGRQS